ncbi:hypothetical protein MauCBS54593_005320 [Microsporum audouinii]
MSSPGNTNRSLWLKKCRHRLSEHLMQSLGVSIPPKEIRLRPTPKHCYRWRVTKPSMGRYFNKDLSKLSTDIYRRLFDEIGKSVIAIPLDSEYDDQAMDNPPASLASSSNESSVSQMMAEIERWKSSAESTATTLEKLRTELENERNKNERLQKAVQYFRSRETSRESNVQELLNQVEKLRNGQPFSLSQLST